MVAPIRVLYIRDTTFICGPGKTILNTFRTANRANIEMTLGVPCSTPESNPFITAAKSIGLPVVDLPEEDRLDIGTAKRLGRIIRDGQFDLIQSHDFRTRRLASLACIGTGVPHVTSVHGWIANSRKQRVTRVMDKMLIRGARRIIAVSDCLVRDLVESGAPRERIALFPNAVLLDDYPPAMPASVARQQLGLPASSKCIGIVGRLSREKRHDLFLEMAAGLASTEPDLFFLIVGHGPLQPDLRRLAERLKIASRVLFLGHRSDMHRIYAALNLLVLCSDTEGMPNVVLEAFAYSRAVVATRVGGVPELVTDRGNGLVVPPGQLTPLVAAARALVKDADLAARLGQSGRRTVEEHFDFRRRTAAVEALYQSILDVSRPQRGSLANAVDR
jgi:glycosyltransferase involved in cell wall biosynthesis